MDLGLNGKRALVTGGSLGIGKAIALELAREGVGVAVVAGTKDRLEAAARELEGQTGRTVIPLVADVSSKEQVDRAVAQAADRLGGLHILVNSGSAPGGSATATGPIETVVDEDLLQDFNVKYIGALRCARAAIPYLKQHGWGRIINISGTNARNAGNLSGGARNGSLVHLTKTLAVQLGRDGITVNCIHPGRPGRWRRASDSRISARGAMMTDWKPPTQARVEGYFKELNNWGRWGHDDQRGTANLITAAKRAQAASLVRTGRTVSLARDIGPQPAIMYNVTFPSNRERADVVLDRFDLVYHGFSITHIDALCHVAWDGELYNGRPFKDSLTAAGATWCAIDAYFDGLTTRGVLLDVAAGRTEGYVTVGQPVTPKELDAVAARAGVKIEPGDVVVMRNGDEAFRKANPDWVPRVSPHPGMHLSCLEWFREKDIAAIAWDMMDERPTSYPGFAMSTHLAIPFLGLVLLDNTNPERLARACAEEGRYEFLFTSTPIRLVWSTCAPAHPLAVF